MGSWPQEALGKQGSGLECASNLLNHREPVFPVPALGLGFPMVVVELLLVLVVRLPCVVLHPPGGKLSQAGPLQGLREGSTRAISSHGRSWVKKSQPFIPPGLSQTAWHTSRGRA